MVSVRPARRCTSPLGIVPAGSGEDVGDCHDVANFPMVYLFISLFLSFLVDKPYSFFQGMVAGGHAGIGVVSLGGVSLCLPSFVTLQFQEFFRYRSNWPRCLLWHGWLPGLNGISAKDPWATCLGAYPVDFADAWTPPEYWDADDIALEMPEHTNVWTDGSREDFSSFGGFEVAGAGVYLPASELAFDSSIWETAEEYGDTRLER